MTLTPLSAFDDNYLWLLDNGREALVVDPGDAAPVVAALDARGLTLAGILLTHHHGDHVGGVNALRERLQGPVYGPAHEKMPEPVQRLRGGDAVELLGLRLAVLDVPGHTAGHIAYFATVPGADPLLFCGDTLFSAGCGRLFEGTPAQMHASLQALAALPQQTRVCCAHEYTLANLRFAREVDPANAALAAYAGWCEAERAAGRPTLPGRVGTERLINPFLRCAEPALCDAARRHAPLKLPAVPSPVDVFATLREWKNGFR
ncbi:hydroxyacylglutathione hydrolase [Roseateles sp. BYS96W]|uniref:Hydroxyacylglutathione hydrolase n=1 Tax=Pelomonas nitida TaxID=3299027 RepID=A0ABW7G3E6_9BURK